MEVDDRSKLVQLWLTQAEASDPALRDSLKPLYQKYKAQNYLVAVFQSGTQDLYQQTHDLLFYNRRHLAEREARAHKRHEMTI